jgi:hypothetical protein
MYKGAMNDAKRISNVIPEIIGNNNISLSCLRIPHDAFIRAQELENFPIIYPSIFAKDYFYGYPVYASTIFQLLYLH